MNLLSRCYKILGTLLLFALFSAFSPVKSAHSELYPQDYFGSPVGIPIVLSGNFGELRSNHFHMGLDIKTGGKEGYKIYNIADGFVSRIKISPTGYGKALYVDHPNGYTSVYAHLRDFEGIVATYLKRNQYESQQSAIELFPKPGELYIPKGEHMAYSGNSGGSKAPHLHFEIRETETEHPVNPLLFGYNIRDDKPPRIYGINTYKIGDYSAIKLRNHPAIAINSKTYKIKSKITTTEPRLAVSLKAFDSATGASNLYGVYKLRMKVDGVEQYYFEMDKLSFDETRYINAHIDFHMKKKANSSYMRCFRLPGNQLSIYDKMMNEGFILLPDGQERKVSIEVEDFTGNTSTLNFSVQRTGEGKLGAASECERQIRYNEENYLYEQNIEAIWENGSFYENFCLDYEVNPAKSSKINSAVHSIGKSTLPVHKYFSIAIHPEKIVAGQMDKSVLMHMSRGGREKCLGGMWDGHYVRADSREFGRFYTQIDTIPPVITLKNCKEGVTIKRTAKLLYYVNDELAGVDTYNAYLNGEWILLDYDKKYKRITCELDNRGRKGNNVLKLEVRDAKGNLKTHTRNFKHSS